MPTATIYPTRYPTSELRDAISVFPSRLGWMAIAVAGTAVKQVTFGHQTAAAARAALDPCQVAGASPGRATNPLTARLQAYAEGERDDFRDVRVESASTSDFQRRVLKHCRQVQHGTTITYAELAAKAGYPGAARSRQLHGRESGPIDYTLSSGGLRGWAGRLVLGRRWCGNETPASGPGVGKMI